MVQTLQQQHEHTYYYIKVLYSDDVMAHMHTAHSPIEVQLSLSRGFIPILWIGNVFNWDYIVQELLSTSDTHSDEPNVTLIQCHNIINYVQTIKMTSCYGWTQFHKILTRHTFLQLPSAHVKSNIDVPLIQSVCGYSVHSSGEIERQSWSL